MGTEVGRQSSSAAEIQNDKCPPIGKLCAFEDSPRQWGVMEVDGKVVEKARYMKVAIEENGTMKLTVSNREGDYKEEVKAHQPPRGEVLFLGS